MKRQPTDEILTKIEDTQQQLRESIDQAGELAKQAERLIKRHREDLLMSGTRHWQVS